MTFSKATPVLDVGRGDGTLHPLFGQQVEHYTGIDWAAAVIRDKQSGIRGQEHLHV